MAAFGHHHKRGGAAFGLAASFVVSFDDALNIVHISGQDRRRQDMSLGFLGMCRQQIQLDINPFVAVSASRNVQRAPPDIQKTLGMLALNKVNIVAVNTILVLHVGNGRSEHV